LETNKEINRGIAQQDRTSICILVGTKTYPVIMIQVQSHSV